MKKTSVINNPFIIWNVSGGRGGRWCVSGYDGKGHQFTPLGTMKLTSAVSRQDATDVELIDLAKKALNFHRYEFTGTITVRRDVVGG